MTGKSAQLCRSSVGNGVTLREVSSCCSIGARSHQGKSNEGKEGSRLVFAYTDPCGVTGNEEGGVQALAGVEPPSFKATITVSRPPITSSSRNPNQTCRVWVILSALYRLRLQWDGGVPGVGWGPNPKPEHRIRLPEIIRVACSLGNTLRGGSEEA